MDKAGKDEENLVEMYARPAQPVPSCHNPHEQAVSNGGATVQVANQVPDGSSSQSESSSVSATNCRSQDSTAVNVTLANQLAFTNVRPSSTAQPVDKSDLTNRTSGQKVIVTSVCHLQPSVIVQDIAGMSANSHVDGTSPKRKMSEGEDAEGVAGGSLHNQPLKEPRLEGNENSNEPVVGSESSEGEDIQGETESGEGQVGAEGRGEAAPDPRLARRENVSQLFRLMSMLGPVSHEERERIWQMSRFERVEMMYELQEQIYLRHRYPHYHRHGYYRQRQPHQPQSDEDSDEESIRAANPARFPEKRPPGEAQFPVTDRQILLRQLILGDRTAVCSQSSTSSSNARVDTALLDRMISQGSGLEVIELLKDVVARGRAAKLEHVLRYLALCIRSKNLEVKKAAYAAIQDICRIPTHIFQLVNLIENGGSTSGWGRGLRRALCTWYNNNATNPMHLAMHVTKYGSRHNWTHRDVFRLAHIKPVNDAIGFIIRYAVRGMQEAETYYLEDGYLGREQLEKVHKYLKVVEEAKQCTEVARTVELIKEHRLVREQLRTQMLNEPDVWKAMLDDMPLTALIRNLGKMSAIKLFDDPDMVRTVMNKLTNETALKKARVHPYKILLAHHVYSQGRGEKGELTWQPNDQIQATLDRAFYQSFGLVEPTNKRILIALDISGSMTAHLQDGPISCREASCLMAMVTIRAENHCDVMGFHTKLIPLDKFKDTSQTLNQLVEYTSRLEFGGTDCSKPMTWARKKRKEYDAFIIYTDSETNSHLIPPYLALDKYREAMNIPTAKLVVVAMTSNDVSIARPDDLHMLDLVGFDSDTPSMISDFLTGDLE